MNAEVLALLDKLKSARTAAAEGGAWCDSASALVDDAFAETMEEWYELNVEFPQYWAHCYYLSNPDGFKALFRASLVHFFSDHDTDDEVSERLVKVGANVRAQRAAHRAFGKEHGRGRGKFAGALLWRSVDLLDDADVMAVPRAVDVLLVCIARKHGERIPEATARLNDYWRGQTTVDQWAGR